MDLLQTTLCLPTCPEQLQLLCAAILREMSPCDSLSLYCDHIQNTRQLSLVASVLLAQVAQLSPLRLATLPLVPLGPREKQQASVQSLSAGSAWLPSMHQFLWLPQERAETPAPCLCPSSLLPPVPKEVARTPCRLIRLQGLGCSGNIPRCP